MTIYQIEIWTNSNDGKTIKYETYHTYKNKTQAEKRMKNLNRILKKRRNIIQYYTRIIELQLI